MPTIANANAATKVEISDISRGKGIITVSGATSLTRYVCNADGSTDDRATVLSAITAATADMPAVVDIGPGDYAMTGGIRVQITANERGLTIRGAGATATRFTFTGAFEISSNQATIFHFLPTGTPTPGTLTHYIHDILIEGIGFYDDDPSAHGGGAAVDESHAVVIQYATNARILDCKADSIGDEAFTFTYVLGGNIERNFTVNTPGFGASGAAITVQHGCEDVHIINNICWGSATRGTQSVISGSRGITCEILSAFKCDSIIVANNSVRDFADAGINFNTNAAVNITASEISENTIDNCNDGIRKDGATGNVESSKINQNVITNSQNYGIELDAALTVVDCELNYNSIDTSTVGGILIRGQTLDFVGNKVSNCPRGFRVLSGDTLTFRGGSFDTCGGTLLEEIEVEGGATNVKADGIKVRNSQASSACFKGVPEVINCDMSRTGGILENMIFGATSVLGCKLTGGIRLDASAVNGRIQNNEIGWNDTGGASTAPPILLASGNDDYVVSGNNIDMSGSTNNQECIEIASGAANAVVIGNSCKSLTAGFANAILDAGTGTLPTGDIDGGATPLIEVMNYTT